LTHANLSPLRHPITVWLLHVATLWFWHARVPYDAALANEFVHVVEHASFLVTAVLFWRVIAGARGAGRVSHGFGVVLVFAMALQSVFLSVLLTFARTPWYASYAATTRPWGLEQIADQQLAGAIMWVPGGLVYVAAGLALTVAWLRTAERDGITGEGERQRAGGRGSVGEGTIRP
jgi:putative membrane protein